MARSMNGARVASAALVAALCAGGFAACNLGLDESLINKDGGTDASSAGGTSGNGGTAGTGGSAGGGTGGSAGTGGTAGSGTGGSSGDGGGNCTTKADCPSSGCQVGACTGGKCVYSVCPPSAACEARACDTGTNTCSAPTTIGFHAGKINVGQSLGCAGSAARCVAAFGDYVFVGTDSGLVGWRVTDPTAPEPLTIGTLPFAIAINRLVASAGRLLVLGPTQNNHLSLAWIDPPSDPTSNQVSPTSVTVNFTDAISVGYGGEPGNFFLVRNNATDFYPAAYVTPPVVNNSNLALQPSSGLPNGASIVEASGSRLVGYRTDTLDPTKFIAYFDLETSAGTINAQNAGEQALPNLGDVPTSLGAHKFASGSDGSLVWSTNHMSEDPDSGAKLADGVILRWPLVGAGSTFEDTRSVMLETYPAYGYNDSVEPGPLAVVDPQTVITTVAYPPDTNQTNVYSVTRAGNVLTRGSSAFVLPFQTYQIAVVAGSYYGYVLTPQTNAAPDVPDTAIHIFAPACQ